MKELSIEDKAKRYDDLLMKLKEAKVDNNVCDDRYCCVIDDIVPELKESEGERIRKGIIRSITDLSTDWLGLHGVTKEEVIAWLEKQGEQTSKQFELKAGHWYICHRAYCCRADNLTVKEGERFMCEKDGIVKGFVIKEPEKYFKEVCAPAPMDDEQKPWSEEDRKIIIELIGIFESAVDGGQVAFPYRLLKDYIRILKSCIPQSTWKPSEEQLDALETAVSSLQSTALESLYNDLKKL